MSTTLSRDGIEAVLASLGVESPIPQFPSADIQNSPMSIFVSHLAGILTQLTKCEPLVAYEAIQWPNDEGDLVMILPRLRMKDINVKVLASELMHQFPASPLYGHPFDDGFNLRFFLAAGSLARILLPYIIDRGASYGKDQTSGLREEVDAASHDGERKKIVVEFSSPNLGQAFNGNHLRSTIIGAYIASIYESMGWDVCRMNFLGDWGKHIGLLAVGWSRYGSEELFNADPLRHLLDVYTEIDKLARDEQEAVKKAARDGVERPPEPINDEKDAFFKRMEEGEPEALALWKRFREACVTNYVDLYARMNIKFDAYSGESGVSPETIAEVETILKEKGIEKEQDEAWIIDFDSHGHKGLGTPKLRDRNGSTGYLLRDLAAVLERSKRYSFDEMIYVVTAKQDSHFQQVKVALELMDQSDLANKLQHVSFGPSQKLAPKSGSSGLLLADILDQCQDAVHEFLQLLSEEFFHNVRVREDPSKLTNALGDIALMTQELSIKRAVNFVCDWDNMGTLSPYTGLTLQHWLLKIGSKLEGVVIPREALDTMDYSVFEQEEYESYAEVLRLLAQFPGAVKNSFRGLESMHILTFLFRLTDMLPDVWDVDVDVDGREENAEGAGACGEGPSTMNGTAQGVELEGHPAGEQEQTLQEGEDQGKETQMNPEEKPANEETHGGEPGEMPLQDEETAVVAPKEEDDAKEADSKQDDVLQPESASIGDGEPKEAQENEVHMDQETVTGGDVEATNGEEEAKESGALPEAETEIPATEEMNQEPIAPPEESRGGEETDDEYSSHQDKGKGRANGADEEEDPDLPQDKFVKMAFYECVRQVLENGMRMVGLVPVQ